MLVTCVISTRRLAWTGEYMEQWYGQPMPPITDQQRNVSAGLLYILKGDAGQRAIVAWHMGWKPALEASGRTWLAPFLAELLNDPYSVVRYIAFRSLRQLPAFESFEFDYTGSEEALRSKVTAAQELWQRMKLESNEGSAEILIDDQSTVLYDAVWDIMSERDDKPLDLLE